MNTAKQELISARSADIQQLPVQSESAAVISMIERAARDPSVDIDKLKQLMTMRQEIEAAAAEKTFNISMRAAQAEMGRVRADATNKQTSSKYATYAAMDRVLRPIYVKHGFSLSFDEADSPKPDHIRVLCYVSHEGGHTRTYHKDMPADGKGAKGGDVMTKTHAAGAAASYGMRYLLKGIFNIAIGEDDQDGNMPLDNSAISDEQIAMIEKALEIKDCTEERLLKWATAALKRDIDSISELPAFAFDKALAKIRSL